MDPGGGVALASGLVKRETRFGSSPQRSRRSSTTDGSSPALRRSCSSGTAHARNGSPARRRSMSRSQAPAASTSDSRDAARETELRGEPEPMDYGTAKEKVERVMLGERGSLQLCGDNLPGAVLTAFSQDMVGASFKFKWQRVKLEKDNTVKAKNIRDARQPRYVVSNADVGYRLRCVAAPVSAHSHVGKLTVAVSNLITLDGGAPMEAPVMSRRCSDADREGRRNSLDLRSTSLDLKRSNSLDGRTRRTSTLEAAAAAPAAAPTVPLRQLRRMAAASIANDPKTSAASMTNVFTFQQSPPQSYYTSPPAPGHIYPAPMVHPGPPPGAPPPPPPPPPPGGLGGIAAAAARLKPKLKKNADGSWETVTVDAPQRGEGGPKAAARRAPAAPSVQDKMLSELKQRMQSRTTDLSKIEALENARAKKQDAVDSRLRAAPADVIRRARKAAGPDDPIVAEPPSPQSPLVPAEIIIASARSGGSPACGRWPGQDILSSHRSSAPSTEGDSCLSAFSTPRTQGSPVVFDDSPTASGGSPELSAAYDAATLDERVLPPALRLMLQSPGKWNSALDDSDGPSSQSTEQWRSSSRIFSDATTSRASRVFSDDTDHDGSPTLSTTPSSAFDTHLWLFPDDAGEESAPAPAAPAALPPAAPKAATASKLSSKLSSYFSWSSSKKKVAGCA